MFEFNLYSSLLLPAFVQGILFTVLLLSRWIKERNLKDFWLAILVLLASIRVAYWMLGFAGWYDSHDAKTVFMFYFPFSTLIALGPVMYLYFLSLTNAHYQLQKRDYFHISIIVIWLGFIVIKALADFVFYYPFENIEDTQYGCKGYFADWDKGYTFIVLSYLIFGYYLQLIYKAYYQYKQYVIQNFSAIEEIQFKWVANLIVAITAIMILFFIFHLLSFVKGYNTYQMQWIPYFLSGIIVYYMSIQGYLTHSHQIEKLNFSIDEAIETENIEVENTMIVNEELAHWKEKISVVMAEQKPYLNPELTLSELSKLMQTNTSLLSKMINEGFEQNFNDFINQYRVNDFVSRIKKGEHKTQTLLSLAYDAGFNSKTTFNRAFKKVFSQTPKEFLDTINQ